MNAKFSEGEVVILQSKYFPALNGEYVVSEIIVEDRFDFDGNISHFGYSLIGSNIDWVESALRKRQQPGTLTYDQLIQSLRSPIYEVN